jgi:chemotaxis-related protein WspB
MLLLTFRAGESLYAVDARSVAEVVPRVALRAIPHAPAYLLGLLGYRGRVAPVADLGVVLGAGRSRDALSTRVVLTRIGVAGDPGRLLGIVAEGVNGLTRVEPTGALLAAIQLDEAPYLGPVFPTDQGLVQVLKPEAILPDRVREALFGAPTEAG